MANFLWHLVNVYEIIFIFCIIFFIYLFIIIFFFFFLLANIAK